MRQRPFSWALLMADIVASTATNAVAGDLPDGFTATA
jgi:hypothetical protein